MGMASVTRVQLAIGLALVVGLANALAVEGAREALRAGFDGLERRALAAAEAAVVSLCAVAGAGIYVLLHHGYALVQKAAKGATTQRPILPALSTVQLFWLSGLALVVTGIGLIVLMQVAAALDRNRANREAVALERGASLNRGRVPGRLGSVADDEDDPDASRSYPAAGGWDDDPDDEWDDADDDMADSRYAPRYTDSRYEPRADTSRRGGRSSRQDQRDDPEDDEDDNDWRRDRGAGRGGHGGRGGR
jgi:hypothetical protein